MSINVQLLEQQIDINETLVRVRLTDGSELNAIRVSASQAIDGEPSEIPGGTFYLTGTNQRIEPSQVVDFTTPSGTASVAEGVNYWQAPDGSWVYGTYDPNLNGFTYYNLDGSPYNGNINDLNRESNPDSGCCCEISRVYEFDGTCYKPIDRARYFQGTAPLTLYFANGSAYTPNPSSTIVEELPPVRYEDRSIALGDNETFDLGTMTEEVSGISIAGTIPVKGGTVVLQNSVGAITYTRPFSHTINSHSDGDTVGGILRVSRFGAKIECVVGIRVRIKPLICPAPSTGTTTSQTGEGVPVPAPELPPIPSPVVDPASPIVDIFATPNAPSEPPTIVDVTPIVEPAPILPVEETALPVTEPAPVGEVISISEM